MAENKEQMQQATEPKESNRAELLGELFESISALPDSKLVRFADMTHGFMLCNACRK